MPKQNPTPPLNAGWSIDFAAITHLFNQAADTGRFQLLEHETYELLKERS